ncbi:DnaJ subfamily C member 19 [Cavenderia fasciculata]|uniref:DnaJ subfamily C member 19 n=1 Tax=Cavenderia fasciculata TaxID=261658 RepID=F4PGQ3_CACFS|nr:DnaJ subfamily C member 19 [Cavenderia fasciculata]EGG24887.1 DnaJ subfamily C member 19 [Cavenderia fasciculata]|eukprot:XP_004362738.1 DnaJ subfamily C member 19 [Cavenderia fasciculata]
MIDKSRLERCENSSLVVNDFTLISLKRYRKMATPFIVGLAVAGAAYATRSTLRLVTKLRQNPGTLFSINLEDKTTDSAIGEGFQPKMDRQEAFAVLGLPDGADDKLIKDQHKKMMIKNHPDKGGSSYLATKVNEARNLLLNRDERR